VDDQRARYRTNHVSTAKFTPANFLLLHLREQSGRVANRYFLAVAVLSHLPSSPKDPFSITATLAAVLLISAAREAAEDLARHAADDEVNYRLCRTLRVSMVGPRKWVFETEEMPWKEVSESVPASSLLAAVCRALSG
jgi:phospholipid-transporting ATPase